MHSLINWWRISRPWKLVVKFWFSKMIKIFYFLLIRQAQWNTTLQKHTNIILKSTILNYSYKVCLQRNCLKSGLGWRSGICLHDGYTSWTQHTVSQGTHTTLPELSPSHTVWVGHFHVLIYTALNHHSLTVVISCTCLPRRCIQESGHSKLPPPPMCPVQPWLPRGQPVVSQC